MELIVVSFFTLFVVICLFVCSPLPPPSSSSSSSFSPISPLPSLLPPSPSHRSGELRMQKLQSHLVKTHSVNVLPSFKAWSRSVYSHTR